MGKDVVSDQRGPVWRFPRGHCSAVDSFVRHAAGKGIWLSVEPDTASGFGLSRAQRLDHHKDDAVSLHLFVCDTRRRNSDFWLPVRIDQRKDTPGSLRDRARSGSVRDGRGILFGSDWSRGRICRPSGGWVRCHYLEASRRSWFDPGRVFPFADGIGSHAGAPENARNYPEPRSRHRRGRFGFRVRSRYCSRNKLSRHRNSRFHEAHQPDIETHLCCRIRDCRGKRGRLLHRCKRSRQQDSVGEKRRGPVATSFVPSLVDLGADLFHASAQCGAQTDLRQERL
mmetsp:Transcript_17578/g.36144  ORF Transcript_17578/g.36144 Transcript_17578/m.36144 type:complete len:283 (-) Transcript_17578:630-1478(-)